MSIKIKGNSEIECKVDIQKEVFWSTKIEDSGNYRYIENTCISAKLQIRRCNYNSASITDIIFGDCKVKHI